MKYDYIRCKQKIKMDMDRRRKRGKMEASVRGIVNINNIRTKKIKKQRGGKANVLFLFFTFFLFFCERKDKPSEIFIGQDMCSLCKMHITDIRFAVQYKLKNGKVKKFDSYPCFWEEYMKDKDNVRSIWFMEFEEKVWITPSQSIFIPYDTPMGKGFVALRKEKSERLTSSLTFEESLLKFKEIKKEEEEEN